MSFLPSFKKKTELVPARSFRVPENALLQQRLENVRNLADVGDRLMMLDKLVREAESAQYTENRYKEDLFGEGKSLLTTLGIAAAFTGIGCAIIANPMALLLMIPGAVGGGVTAHMIQSNVKKNGYDAQFSDLEVAWNVWREAHTLRSQMLEEVDTRVLARSPRAVDAFTRFPSLKEKFMLALTVDKVRAEDAQFEAGLKNAGLGKAVLPPPATDTGDKSGITL